MGRGGGVGEGVHIPYSLSLKISFYFLQPILGMAGVADAEVLAPNSK